jgi:hypothetical protein
MGQAKNLDGDFAGFSGGASGFDNIDFSESLRHGRVVLGTGLSIDAFRSTARRQLVGSIVVACGIAAVAALMTVRPIHVDATVGPAAHDSSVVQHPTFATSAGQNIAVLKTRDIAVP